MAETAKQQKSNLPEGVTAEMQKSWQDRYGKSALRVASLPLDDNGEKFMDVIVRVPDRKVMGEFEKWLDKKPDKAKEILINGCVLTCKEQIKADDNLFFAAFDAVAELIPIRKAVIKNF